jgi:hypothetical protein
MGKEHELNPSRKKRIRVASVFGTLAMVTGMLSAAPAAQGQAVLADCPEIMPLSEVQKGMFGTGYTVVEGRTPQPFQVEVLGVYPDAFLPGRDLIIIEATGSVIDEGGGIWYGMSGSPVYINNKLVGSISFGLTWGPSPLGGVTPAEDMAQVLDYPTQTTTASASGSSGGTTTQRVSFSDRQTSRFATATGLSESEVAGGLAPLKMPLAVGGATPRVMRSVQRAVNNSGLPFIPYATPAVSPGAATAATGTVSAGENFAAAYSYGDISFAGIGTTTYVCDGKALAFGHPFGWTGSTTLGANNADSLTIVKDSLGGSYKLATIAEGLGMVDQDRWAGIRSLLGTMPDLIPMTSSITDLDLSRSRDGETDAVVPEVFTFLAFIHAYANIDSTIDRIGEGSSTASWTISGTRESGEPWTLTRSNMFVSEYDISIESAIELYSNLNRLFYNEFEEITFTGADFDASVQEAIKRYTATNVLVSVNDGEYRDVNRIRVRRGDTISLQVVLSPYDETEDKIVEMTLYVPRRVRTGGRIQIGRGSGGYYEEYFYGSGGNGSSKIESFDELLAKLASKPTNNQLAAKLRMGYRSRVKSRDFELLDQVVDGFLSIRVRLLDGSGGVAIPAK